MRKSRQPPTVGGIISGQSRLTMRVTAAHSVSEHLLLKHPIRGAHWCPNSLVSKDITCVQSAFTIPLPSGGRKDASRAGPSLSSPTRPPPPVLDLLLQSEALPSPRLTALPV